MVCVTLPRAGVCPIVARLQDVETRVKMALISQADSVCLLVLTIVGSIHRLTGASNFDNKRRKLLLEFLLSSEHPWLSARGPAIKREPVAMFSMR